MSNVIAALVTALGADVVRTGEDIPARNHADAGGQIPVPPAALLLPRNTDEVSACLRICHSFACPVVPQGGMTGLAGGAHPRHGEIALSLERLVGIEEVDVESGTLTALAGTPLATIQAAAEAANLMCGIDLGARGTCTIGGNIATNAGGNQVLRYGMARRNVLGLEVVLPDGQVLRSLNKMLKNNAGYDWTQLFIGSEGTLGIITRVVVALHPRPRGIQSALCGVASFSDALAILRRFDALMPGRLLVFEAMWREYMEVATGQFGLAQPFEDGFELTLLLEAAMGDDPSGEEAFAETLASFMEDGTLPTAIIARSENDRRRFWSYREANYEFGRVLPKGSHFDVSIPLGRMSDAVALLREGVAAQWPDAIPIVFGHIADSNIHIAVYKPGFDDMIGQAINEVVYGIVAEVGGSVSAEHGIGVLKRPYLPLSRSPSELAFMRSIKQAVDPLNILNRGRILPESDRSNAASILSAPAPAIIG